MTAPATGPHRLRGRRRQAVDLQLSARRPARLSRDAPAFPRAGQPTRGRTGAWCRWRFRSAPPSRCCRRSMRCSATRRRPTGSRSTAARSAMSRRARARPGWSNCGRRCPAARGAARSAGAPAPAALEPRTRLAHAIAATIAGWLENGRAAGSARPPDPAGRHHGAGAAAQRVRRRPAARAESDATCRSPAPTGSILTEQLAVQDLVALGHFLLLPEDDLTLATVLKGPLFGISEEALFLLAYGRGRETLWQRLRRRAGKISACDGR